MWTDHKNRGFSLIEIMVVMAIIALLSTVIFASISSSRQKAYDTKVITSQNELVHRLASEQVAYYNFDETSGINTFDVAGFFNTGTTSNTTRISEPGRNSLYFNGVDSQVTIPVNFPVPTTNNELTISALINLDVDSATPKVILSPSSNGADNYFEIRNRKVCLEVTEIADVNNQIFCTPTNSIRLNQWTHVSASIKNRDWSISVNGSILAKGTSIYDIGSWGGGYGYWLIGKRAIMMTFPFSGKIDEVRVFYGSDFN